jgi:hypothetical protein
MKPTPTREVLFQRLQRAHLKVSKITVLLEYADDASKKELRRKLRAARGSVESAVLALQKGEASETGARVRRIFNV